MDSLDWLSLLGTIALFVAAVGVAGAVASNTWADLVALGYLIVAPGVRRLLERALPGGDGERSAVAAAD